MQYITFYGCAPYSVGYMESPVLNLIADSISQGSIVVGGRDGVTLLGPPTTLSGSANYHVCACTASRRLFLVPSNSQRCETALNIDSICGL